VYMYLSKNYKSVYVPNLTLLNKEL